MVLINKSIKIGVIIIALFMSNLVEAQISEEGIPPSLDTSISQNLLSFGKIEKISLQPVNVDSIKQAYEEKKGPKPPKYGHPINVNLGISNSGTWQTLPNGDRVWRLKVHAAGAKSLNFVFSEYHLPKGAELFVYNEEHDWVLGAFTDRNNKAHGGFSTDIVKGDKAIIEYYLPSDVEKSQGQVKIDKVTYGYNSLPSFDGHTGGNNPCPLPINCPAGDDWCLQKKSVALIIDPEGGRWCTGAMINNERIDFTDYFLTARHCWGFDDANFVDNWIFRFNYWDPSPVGCPDPNNYGNEPDDWYSLQGANVIADAKSTDASILQLNENFPPEVGVFYAGWTRFNNSNRPPNEVNCLHHPQGQLMKMAVGNYTGNVVSRPNVSCGDCYWEVNWNQGTVHGVSSGSPLFNENGLIIGQLFGYVGQSSKNCRSCNPDNCDYIYGRFDLSWWHANFNDVLDPDDQNPTTVEGFYRCPELKEYQNTNDLPQLASVSDFIEAGSNVRNGANGPVVVQSNENVTLRAENRISLEAGFSVESGGQLLATTEGNCQVNNAECNQLHEEPAIHMMKKPLIVNKKDSSLNTQTSDTKVTLYPNPAEDHVKLKLQSSRSFTPINVTVFTMNGKPVIRKEGFFKKQRKSFSIRMNLQTLSAGVYYYRVEDKKNNLYKGKIIKK